jgi:hypothetical protein
MKFLNYLDENRYDEMTIDEIKKLLEIRCKPILEFMRKKRIGFRRNYKQYNNLKADVESFIPRNDRKPLDTPQDLSDVIDSLLFKKFNWYPRKEGVFTWGRNYNEIIEECNISALVGMFLPQGSFKVLFSPLALFKCDSYYLVNRGISSLFN